MIVKRITLTCPACNEQVIVPFDEIEADWDEGLLLTFECTKCGAYTEKESVEFEEG